MKSVIEINNISKKYGKVEALRGVSLTLDHGIYALLGPNGSGKTTLMNILAGLLAQSGGKILYNGKDIRECGIDYRSRVGFMPQYPAMYPNFAVKEFLLYVAELKKLPPEREGDIDYLLSRVELSDVYDRKISALSGGMKQRLSLCTAVLGDPEILILDEPTAGLDPKQRVALRQFIAEIASNKTVIWATHIVSDVESIADEVIFMKKGEASILESGANMLEEEYLRFFGDVV